MAEIKKVVIEAGGKEFSLSVEEAKALRDILNATFKEPTVTYVPIYQPPIIIERYPQQWGPWITWSSGETAYCSTSKNTPESYCATSNTATLIGNKEQMTYTIKEP
jgi:hypothetical protein